MEMFANEFDKEESVVEKLLMFRRLQHLKTHGHPKDWRLRRIQIMLKKDTIENVYSRVKQDGSIFLLTTRCAECLGKVKTEKDFCHYHQFPGECVADVCTQREILPGLGRCLKCIDLRCCLCKRVLKLNEYNPTPLYWGSICNVCWWHRVIPLCPLCDPEKLVVVFAGSGCLFVGYLVDFSHCMFLQIIHFECFPFFGLVESFPQLTYLLGYTLPVELLILFVFIFYHGYIFFKKIWSR